MNDIHFTEAEEAYIIAHYRTSTIRAMSVHLGRKRSSVQYHIDGLVDRGILSRAERYYHRTWTEEEDQVLTELWGTVPDSVVARRLKRSVSACKIRTTRHLHINRSMAMYNATNVAYVFGIDPNTVVSWVEKGWIKARKSHLRAGLNARWEIDEASLLRFVMGMPWAYDRKHMAPGEYLTRLAEETHRKDPWLLIEEASRLAGAHPGTLRKWCLKGLIPARRRPKYAHAGPHAGRWVIRQVDLWPAMERVKSSRRERQAAGTRRRAVGDYLLVGSL